MSGYPFRIRRYFEALPPRTLVSFDDLWMLLYRGRDDGGPLTADSCIRVYIYKANKLPGRKIKADAKGGPRQGWRME